jgi:uncharacterized protein (DUF362 family)
MSEISRRDFLRLSALVAATTTMSACARTLDFTPTVEIVPDIKAESLAQVASLRGTDLHKMTIEILEAIGGIQKIVHEGETVFIKPNMVTLPWAKTQNCFASGECTKPEIVITVAEECLRAGAARVIIGDGSQMPSMDWGSAVTLDGSTNLAAAAQRLSASYAGEVAVASLEVDSPAWVEVPSRTHLGKIAISSLVAEADRVISIPVAKTHAWAQLTLSSKNFIGVTPLKRYGLQQGGTWLRSKILDHSSPESIAAYYLDIVDAINPDLAIVDFSIGVEGNGPSLASGGATLDMKERLGSWLLLASTDLMAADATAARIMNHDVAAVKQLGMGYDIGLGEIREERIEVIGERLEDLRVAWKPAQIGGPL